MLLTPLFLPRPRVVAPRSFGAAFAVKLYPFLKRIIRLFYIYIFSVTKKYVLRVMLSTNCHTAVLPHRNLAPSNRGSLRPHCGPGPSCRRRILLLRCHRSCGGCGGGAEGPSGRKVSYSDNDSFRVFVQKYPQKIILKTEQTKLRFCPKISCRSATLLSIQAGGCVRRLPRESSRAFGGLRDATPPPQASDATF